MEKLCIHEKAKDWPCLIWQCEQTYKKAKEEKFSCHFTPLPSCPTTSPSLKRRIDKHDYPKSHNKGGVTLSGKYAGFMSTLICNPLPGAFSVLYHIEQADKLAGRLWLSWYPKKVASTMFGKCRTVEATLNVVQIPMMKDTDQLTSISPYPLSFPLKHALDQPNMLEQWLEQFGGNMWNWHKQDGE